MQKILNLIKKIIPTSVFKFFQPFYHYAMSFLAALFYRFPSEKIIVIGITGTTGKTTSVYLMAEALKACGLKVGYTSTAMFSDGNKEWLNDKKMTMLGLFFTQKMIAQMVKNGCRYAIIETTSEGIIQFRHRFINYDILVFTGLYPEHIESHGGFENYKMAKGLLFAHLERCNLKYIDNQKRVLKNIKEVEKIDAKRVAKTIIANGDDENVEYFLRFWAEKKYKIKMGDFEIKSPDDKLIDHKVEEIRIDKIKLKDNKTYFNIDGIDEFELSMLGKFNVINAAFSIVVGYAENLKIAKIKNALKNINSVPGRLERINMGQNFEVIVDYAFEPNALTKLFETLDALNYKKIIHVVGGTGGGRDAARRPILGSISANEANVTIITNEDPYDDNPKQIIQEVAIGAKNAGKKENKDLFIIEDRRAAIRKALELASKNDIVIITGKGSEQAICVANGQKIPWDDRTVVREEYKKI
ncbi:MAG: UDP-N-acetylmuramyl-tripeptide synthetase [Candidatus Falkowbacteria bacterium]|nr:UDP-N-acetylmuramyl-tripeptide synthetase [Candidatus Falkowbacteria bacterium]